MIPKTPSDADSDSRMPIVALVAMVVAVGGAALIGRAAETLGVHTAKSLDGRLFDEIERGEDHIGCVEFARELLKGSGDVEVVDLRPNATPMLPGSVSMTLPELLGPKGDAVFAKNPRLVVLCSQGTTHPGQAWVELRRRGHGNVKVLDGGFDAFRLEVLAPPSLRPGAEPERDPRKEVFRRMCESAFTPVGEPTSTSPWVKDPETLTEPCVVSGAWLAEHQSQLAILDVRPAVEFDLLHVPGSVRLDVESLRTDSGPGEAKVLRPDAELATRFGELGVGDDTPVVLVTSDRLQDATLAALALLRIEHRRVAMLDGGFHRWLAQRLPATAELVVPRVQSHGVGVPGDDFTIGIDDVRAGLAQQTLRIVDMRTQAEFEGTDVRDAKRAGHVPGAEWLYPESLFLQGTGTVWTTRAILGSRLQSVSGDRPVVLMCHSGHRASAGFFAARFLLGRTDAKWFEGSWLAWAGRSDLPIEK